MRPVIALLLCAPACLAGAPALAQVSVDSHALDALGSTAPARPAPHAAAIRAPEHRTRTPARPAHETPHPAHGTGHAAPAHPAPARPATPPTVAAAPPTVAVLPPVAPPPPHPATPLPTVPVVADAPGSASPLPAGGTRVTFGADRSDLNPGTAAAIHAVGEALRADPNATVDVIAHAGGTPDDPSTPRRLSLARGLAARAALLGAGIPSTRIYVRALGDSLPDDGPADRVDVGRTLTPAKSPLAIAAPAGTAAPAAAPRAAPPAAVGASRP